MKKIKINYEVIDENINEHCKVGDYVQVVFDDGISIRTIKGYISDKIDFGVLAIEDKHKEITFIEIYKINKIEKVLQ